MIIIIVLIIPLYIPSPHSSIFPRASYQFGGANHSHYFSYKDTGCWTYIYDLPLTNETKRNDRGRYATSNRKLIIVANTYVNVLLGETWHGITTTFDRRLAQQQRIIKQYGHEIKRIELFHIVIVSLLLLRRRKLSHAKTLEKGSIGQRELTPTHIPFIKYSNNKAKLFNKIRRNRISRSEEIIDAPSNREKCECIAVVFLVP